MVRPKTGEVNFTLESIENGADGSLERSHRRCERLEGRHANDWDTVGERQTLGDAYTDTQAREGARASRHREQIDGTDFRRGSIQYAIDEGKKRRRMVPAGRLLLVADDTVDPQADTGLGRRRVDPEYPHPLAPALDDTGDIVVEGEGHQADQDDETNLLGDLAMANGEGAAQHSLDREEE